MKFSIPFIFVLAFLALLTGGCSGKDLAAERQTAYQAYAAGDYAQAAEKFEILVEEVPKDAELWFRLGNSQAKMQAPEKAVEAYRNALLRDPSMAKAWYNMGLIHLQAALKSFADMQGQVNDDDPAALKGREMRDGIMSLLGKTSGTNGQKD